MAENQHAVYKFYLNRANYLPFKLKEVDYNLKFKLDRKHLIPASTVKYLGVLLDDHLLCSKQISHVTTKLNQAIGILSKLRNNTSLKTLNMTYHSLFPCMDLSYGRIHT